MTKTLVMGLALLMVACQHDRPSDRMRRPEIETIVQGKPFEHVFVLPNTGRDSLVVRRVIANMGDVTHVDSVIPPASTGRIAVRVDFGQTLGVVNEAVRVDFAGNRPSARLHVLRRVVAPIEIAPQNDFYFFTAQGEPAQRELSVVNHMDTPVTVRQVMSSNPLFHTTLTPLEAGHRYDLVVSLDTAAPVGRHSGTIRVITDSRDYPTLVAEGHALVKPVVSASLDTVDYVRVEHASLDRDATAERTVLVRKYRGTDFQVVQATTNVPFLTTDVEPDKVGESYFVRVRIRQDRAPRGRFAGTLRIETNDPTTSELTLPIRGEIL